MIDLGVLCCCRFCRSEIEARFSCGNPIILGYCSCGRYWRDHAFIVLPDAEYPLSRVVVTGGRRARWIVLEGEERAVHLSARKVGIEMKGVVARFAASVHGCWKIRKNQEIVVVKEGEKCSEHF